MTDQPAQRVSAIAAPERYDLPGRPEASSAAVDAYRQAQFVLGGDLTLFAEAMNLQLALVQDARPSQYRTQPLAALTGLWSRCYVYLQDGMLLALRGSYAGVAPLVRATVESIAAQDGLRGGEMEEHQAWLRETLRPDETFKAFEFALGHYHAGSVIAFDPLLNAIYRPVSDLARPNFGATLLQVGPESNNQRLALSFADASFHLGWAELTVGWLVALAARQVKTVVEAEGIFPISDERRVQYEDLQRRVDASLASNDRCRLEEVQEGNDRRYLIHNFRRNSSGAPKKILL